MSLFTEPTPTPVTLADLVGENAKYKTNEDLVKAVIEKDRFINQLQGENAQHRETISKIAPPVDRSQEILAKMDEMFRSRPPITERQPEPLVTERIVDTQGLTVEDVDKLLNEREKARLRTQNVELVKEELTKRYGPNYSEVLKQLAGKLSVGTDFLEQTAATSPQAFLRLVETEKTPSVFTPPVSGLTASFQPSGQQHQKQSYYEKLKVSDKKAYLSPAVQQKQMNDALALGEAYFD